MNTTFLLDPFLFIPINKVYGIIKKKFHMYAKYTFFHKDTYNQPNSLTGFKRLASLIYTKQSIPKERAHVFLLIISCDCFKKLALSNF